MNLCEKCEWCATCLKRGECIPIQPAPEPLKFPEILPNLLPTKETTA
jgi:hypothetical protein